jgi:hypothetical protein
VTTVPTVMATIVDVFIVAIWLDMIAGEIQMSDESMRYNQVILSIQPKIDAERKRLV